MSFSFDRKIYVVRQALESLIHLTKNNRYTNRTVLCCTDSRSCVDVVEGKFLCMKDNTVNLLHLLARFHVVGLKFIYYGF